MGRMTIQNNLAAGQDYRKNSFASLIKEQEESFFKSVENFEKTIESKDESIKLLDKSLKERVE